MKVAVLTRRGPGALLALSLSASAPAWASQPLDLRQPANALHTSTQDSEPAPEAKQQESRADGRRTLGRLPANIGRGLLGVWSKDGLKPLLLGSGATFGASFFDEEIREDLGNPDNDFGQALETGGGPIYSSAIVLGLFVGGRFAHSERFRAMSYDMLVASLVSAGYTQALKLAVGRERPNGEDNKSFPSGHASNAFALAAVAQRHYGWKLGAPSYLVAGLVGASRLQRDKHWLSDVVAGATLGIIVGQAVVRVNDRPAPGAPPAGTRARLMLAPIVAPRGLGLALSGSF